MAKLHTCKLDDSVGDTHVLRDKTLHYLHAEIGPSWPIELDGRPGVLGYASKTSDEIVFIPSE